VKLSLIICSIDAQKYSLVTANVAAVFANVAYEIIGVHDAKSLSEGYNRGVACSRGDVVIFCHDDIEILTPDFYPLLTQYLRTYDIVGSAGTSCVIESAWPAAGDPFTHGVVAYPVDDAWPADRYNVVVWGGTAPLEVPNIQALDGCFFAVKRVVLEHVRFDEISFDGFHVYDTDFTFAAYLQGFKLAVGKNLVVAHKSGGNFDGQYEVYGPRFLAKYHGNLATSGRNSSKAVLAKNLDRAGVLRLFENGAKTPPAQPAPVSEPTVISMKQTPLHFIHNPDVLKMMPPGLGRVVEVGCSSGALAKAYKSINPACYYTGIEIDADFSEVARQSCNEVLTGNIEHFEQDKFRSLFPSDCWIFGDVLEHLYDPWALLKRIRPHLASSAQIIACVPNAQHWSIQTSLNCGQFRYQDQGLLDRTHIRWFTRTTLIEMFAASGYKITEGVPRIFDEPHRDKILPHIHAMAVAIGADPQQAVNDAIPFQWVVKAVPA
jgi:2-polyprenyl-3-methyl-5-hydroxy-6-metoxy-1,4-benzoquinol methylase